MGVTVSRIRSKAILSYPHETNHSASLDLNYVFLFLNNITTQLQHSFLVLLLIDLLGRDLRRIRPSVGYVTRITNIITISMYYTAHWLPVSNKKTDHSSKCFFKRIRVVAIFGFSEVQNIFRTFSSLQLHISDSFAKVCHTFHRFLQNILIFLQMLRFHKIW